VGQNAEVELTVAADDRTGAFETAAAMADRRHEPVTVVSWPSMSPEAIFVVDLGTRHLTPADARDRVRSLPETGRLAHKIDSTLRGNWPDELSALAARRPVLLIPALPELGRTCVDGVVLDHGRPVNESHAGSDVRRRVVTSRPAEALRSAGQRSVTNLADVGATEVWLKDPTGVAVADAGDTGTIERLVAAWGTGPRDVVLAGTSGVIGAAARPSGATGAPADVSPVDGPILVVCGSVHPAARAQLETAEREGMPLALIADEITARQLDRQRELILATEIPVGDVDEPLAVASSTALATGVAMLRRSVWLGALVLIGGDTAAAVLGDATVRVHGSVGAGTAWATVDGVTEPVITRSGGFGGDRAIVELVRGALRS
jgi:uncharacterized protein YgbK (DUF1537 family)